MTRFSSFGEHFQKESGTRQLMDDLGEVLSSGRDIINLGGGNPGAVPEIRAIMRQCMRDQLDSGTFDEVIGYYDGPQGHMPFRQALAGLLQRRYGWTIGAENIALTSGSQASFFALFNLLAGAQTGDDSRHILLPLTPEYIGYADVGLTPNSIRSIKPSIELLPNHSFKYRVDFDNLILDDRVAAVCLSRPTNPTGNVVDDTELNRLAALTKAHGIPLIVDNAYGQPFPNIVFCDSTPVFDEHIILCMSLSKLGLPGLRTGIIVAAPELIHAVTSMNAISMLATSSMGASLVTPLFESDEVIDLSDSYIKPFYEQKCAAAQAWCHASFAGLDYRIHKTEGAIFLWVWFPQLPISDIELYRRLKDRDVLVLAGRHFFPGLRDDWDHTHQCIRLSYAQDPKAVQRGIEIIGEEVRRAMSE